MHQRVRRLARASRFSARGNRRIPGAFGSADRLHRLVSKNLLRNTVSHLLIAAREALDGARQWSWRVHNFDRHRDAPQDRRECELFDRGVIETSRERGVRLVGAPREAQSCSEGCGKDRRRGRTELPLATRTNPWR